MPDYFVDPDFLLFVRVEVLLVVVVLLEELACTPFDFLAPQQLAPDFLGAAVFFVLAISFSSSVFARGCLRV